MRENISYIKRHLKKKLDEERYEHSLGVAYTAMCLAMRYGENLYQAEVAGLLHDCAKYLPDDMKIERCKKYNISISPVERMNPSLLHAKLGAFLAMEKYEIKDMDIINAILSHTTGKPAMTMLEKIIYVADYIEPRRDKARELPNIRKLAFVDIDQAVYEIMKESIEYIKTKNVKIDETTYRAFEYYSTHREERLDDKQ